MEIFEYASMWRAFIVGIPLVAVIPCIGLVIMCKRLSMIGDIPSHTSLAGVAAGLILGPNPVLTTATVRMVAATGIEAIRRKVPRFSEMSITVIMSVGIGLAGALSGSVKNTVDLNSFLSGNIVAIGNGELYLVVAVSMAVLFTPLPTYKELSYVSLGEQNARLTGVPVKTVDFLFTALVVVTVSVAARAMGALIASSIIAVPVVCVIQFGAGYRQTLTFAVAFNILFTITGLFAAYYLRLKSGDTTVLVGVIFPILVFVGKRTLRRR